MKRRSKTSAIFRRFSRDCTGVAAVEFALLAPFVVLILMAIWDLGAALNESVTLENGARVGAAYAVHDHANTAAIKAAVENATKYPAASLTVTQTLFCECSNGATMSCTTPICPSGTFLHTYITITVSSPYDGVLPTSKYIVGNLSGSATMRMQ